MAKSLCHHAKFRVVCANSSPAAGRAALASKLAGPVDVVVGSPTKLLQHVKEGRLFYRDVRWLVSVGAVQGLAHACAHVYTHTCTHTYRTHCV